MQHICACIERKREGGRMQTLRVLLSTNSHQLFIVSTAFFPLKQSHCWHVFIWYKNVTNWHPTFSTTATTTKWGDSFRLHKFHFFRYASCKLIHNREIRTAFYDLLIHRFGWVFSVCVWVLLFVCACVRNLIEWKFSKCLNFVDALTSNSKAMCHTVLRLCSYSRCHNICRNYCFKMHNNSILSLILCLIGFNSARYSLTLCTLFYNNCYHYLNVYIFIYSLMSLMRLNRLIVQCLCIMQSSIWNR